MGRQFTSEQKAVIYHNAGHARVDAVPGSGKTTVLVGRLRRLVREGKDPSTILAVMFNKSAQRDFSDRLERAIGGACPDVRTFHSVGLAMLKRLIQIGRLQPRRLVTSPRTIAAIARRTLRAAWAEHYGTGERPPREYLESFIRFITLVKSDTQPPDVIFDQGDYLPQCCPFIAAFNQFQEVCADQQIMFFDDMIYRPVLFLHHNTDDWKLFADKLDEILVDEAQDMNPINFELVKGLAGTTAACIAVGDADQSVYAFRGSKFALLLDAFPAHFSPCTRFPMTRTFRFGHAPALFANHLIANNTKRDNKIVVAAPTTPETTLERHTTGPKAPTGIAKLMEPYAANGTLHTGLILGRNFAHLVPYELDLVDAGIAFFVEGRQPLLFVPEVAALVTALSLTTGHWIVQAADREHFFRSLLSVPTMFAPSELIDEVASAMTELSIAGDDRRVAEPLVMAARRARSGNSRLAHNLEERANVVQVLASQALIHDTPRAVIEAYARMTGLEAAIDRTAADKEQASEMQATLTAFLSIADRKESIIELLDVLGPLAAHSTQDPPEGDYVPLTSIHRAKGREASLVVVVGLAESIFPSMVSPSSSEEERRLAYVAVTRAIDRLVLFHPADQYLESLCEDTGEPIKTNTPRCASVFMYEGEPGLAVRTAAAIRAGRHAKICARRDDIAKSYIDEIACDALTFTVSKAAAKASSSGSYRPVDPAMRLQQGQKLYHRDRGLCTVIQFISHPVYRMADQDKVMFHTVITTPGEWFMPA